MYSIIFKQVALIVEQIGSLCLGDEEVALIGGQTGCLYWGTNRLLLLWNKQVAWGCKQVALIRIQVDSILYWGQIGAIILEEKRVAFSGRLTGCP